MKRGLVIGVLAAGVLWRVSTSSGQPTDEELIRRARDASNEAIQNHDAEAVASLFTENYSLVASTNLQITGKDANRESFAEHFEE